MKTRRAGIKAVSVLLTAAGLGGASALAGSATLSMELENVQPRQDRHRILGTNLAMWHEPKQLFHENVIDAIQAVSPTFLRIPGGSWSNEIYWNGNGVRNGDTFDHSKLVDGIWQVDYSDYAPGFRLHKVDGELSDYHGVVDVKTLHEKVKAMGARPVVTVNAGTGTPEMAAEWVRWANITNDYGVTYWEVGNELEGAWEIGHIQADGTPLTGKTYAERFRRFARAMKAVDPTIKVGGPVASNLEGGFMKDLLQYAGDDVDFVSFHTYPVGKGHGNEQAFFDALSKLQPALATYRDWIREFQPDRAEDIEIALTEWNSKVFEDRDTGDLLNGLWSAAWMGEMVKGNISFANQWDLLTRTETGGHGQMANVNGTWVPTGQYWATLLWSQTMGNDWIPTSLEGESDLLHVTATRDERGIHLLVVNFDREASTSLSLPQTLASWKGAITTTTLSHASYFWDPIQHQPLWSEAPYTASIPATDAVTVPPYSARVFSFSSERMAPLAETAPKGLDRNGPRILLPKTSPADLRIEGWLFTDSASASGAQPMTVTGPATLNVSEVQIDEGAGRFFLTPTGTGMVTVAAGALTAQLEIKPVEARDVIFWSFENEPDTWNMKSDYTLLADSVARPNQGVARVDLNNALPEPGRDVLVNVEALPNTMERTRIGGVVVDLKVSPGLSCPNEKTGIQVVLQSQADHWIPLGILSLPELEGDWQTVRIPLPSTDLIPLMEGAYALRLQLVQGDEDQQPVTGTLFVDNLGFIYR